MRPGEAYGPPQVINLFLMSADWISELKAHCVIKGCAQKANTSSHLYVSLRKINKISRQIKDKKKY